MFWIFSLFFLVGAAQGKTILTVRDCSILDSSPIHETVELESKKFYIGTFYKANWFKATQFCVLHGITLATINSQEEHDALENRIKAIGMGHQHFWTSGNNLADEENYMWMPNGQPFNYTNWNQGEPYGDHNCVELFKKDDGLKWRNYACSTNSFFICETPINKD